MAGNGVVDHRGASTLALTRAWRAANVARRRARAPRHGALTEPMIDTSMSRPTGEEPRISTGVPGLDDILGGGLTPSRLYLLEGTPGTGKTTLALQFLREGAAARRARALRHPVRDRR